MDIIVKNLALFLLCTLAALRLASAEQALSVPENAISALNPSNTNMNRGNMNRSSVNDSGTTLSPTGLQRCFQELDQATLSFENGRADRARDHLERLLQSCDKVPQLYHNLGTLALLERKWNDAIEYFELSLALDKRAAMTQQTLSSVYQYKAALAYKRALNLTGQDPKLPTIKMQSSDIRNSHDLNSLPNQAKSSPIVPEIDRINEPREQVNANHDISQTVKEAQFDVANWWQAQRSFDLTAYFSYYYPGVFPSAFESAAQWNTQWADARISREVQLPPWPEVQFEAEPLDNYMLVNLRFYNNLEANESAVSNATQQFTQSTLVLQKTGQLWQIIKEKSW